MNNTNYHQTNNITFLQIQIFSFTEFRNIVHKAFVKEYINKTKGIEEILDYLLSHGFYQLSINNLSKFHQENWLTYSYLFPNTFILDFSDTPEKQYAQNNCYIISSDQCTLINKPTPLPQPTITFPNVNLTPLSITGSFVVAKPNTCYQINGSIIPELD